MEGKKAWVMVAEYSDKSAYVIVGAYCGEPQANLAKDMMEKARPSMDLIVYEVPFYWVSEGVH
jgi:hypothetical protein